ncbi:CBS domain-containing protein CBSX3, mitochondrial-like [Andrographis paniculata]|uniref:CBS domain-containing protein CBSX3, mitochondrial-like n=1 Tax=Andrographis paniculata TaxID=175694 RepID=UPI0021E7234E|nr:CBS domain-containing protein CBSX3, mitochondrial-like [Andrographis paniculata]XP_051124005.1 CBS domain-containing protein CBSX3, mitochondrial-like [Andrographis paniculata]
MQGFLQAIRKCHEQYIKKLGDPSITTMELIKTFSAQGHNVSFPPATKSRDGLNDAVVENGHSLPHKGLQNTTVAEVLMTKGEEKVGSWLWCYTNDTVYDAVKQMAHSNIGSLVVLKPGEQQLIAGILTERDYLRKVIVQDRSSKYTKVAEIMTNQLITVTSDTNILRAMQLMTENHIRHAPVIDGRIVGMISIVDVVRAVLEQQQGEVKQLNEFIQGDYR